MKCGEYPQKVTLSPTVFAGSLNPFHSVAPPQERLLALHVGRLPHRGRIGVLLHGRVLVVEFLYGLDDFPLANSDEEIVQALREMRGP